MKKFLLLLGLVLLVGSSCSKKTVVTDLTYPDFIGYWEAYDGVHHYEFDFHESGSAAYLKTSGATVFSTTGKAKIIEGKDKLKIGFSKLEIDTYPFYDTLANNWTMVLDGATYWRY